MAGLVLMAGTRKGAFFLESNDDRSDWTVSGPSLKGWKVSNLQVDPRSDGRLFAAVSHFVYGPTIHRSRDGGQSWTQVDQSPAFSGDDSRDLNQIWTLTPGPPSQPETLYAGVDDVGLFVSHDGGNHWAELEGLTDHQTRDRWMGGKGGLCCHSILVDPEKPERIWVGISAVGVFRTTDGGTTWTLQNDGLATVGEDEPADSLGSCVHRLIHDPANPDHLFQQNHMGVYRSRDGGDLWEPIHDDLPSRFGFPMVMHPRDSRTLYTVPLESDEYRMAADGSPAVYRTRDAGDSWDRLDNGLPTKSWLTVLRHAMTTDPLEPAGVYVGTTGGRIHYSTDGGDTWATVDCHLPRILSLSTAVIP